MKIIYEQAKNNTTTCSIEGIFVHSKYNPEKEAERFVANLSLNCNTTQLLILEPCLSYIGLYLKKQFPDIKLIALHFCEEFTKFSKTYFDKVLIYNQSTFFNDFYPFFNEENLHKTEIITWIGSETIFSKELQNFSQEIKKHIATCKDILATRFYFSPKWRNNSIKYFTTINQYIASFSNTKPIIIAASGPSLESSLDAIKNNRKFVFLIALSSAISPLLARNIIPDLCISTDGGYWAEKHLEILIKHHIPLAITPESAINSRLLQEAVIFPLTYGEQLELDFYHYLGIEPFLAEQNGTVSGTAVKLALQLTPEKIAVCGLDMSEPSGYPHIQPNALEIEKENHDSKLNSKELRLYNPNKNASLLIYKNWFQGAAKSQFEKRVFRIHNKNDKLTSIENFDECTIEDFIKSLNKTGKTRFLVNKKNGRNFYSKLSSLYDNLKKSSILSKEIGNYFAFQSYFQYKMNQTEENFIKVRNEILVYLEKKLQNHE